MPEMLTVIEMPPLVLRLASAVKLTEKQFFQLCQINDFLRLERTSEGDLVIMPPEGGESGRISFDLAGQFGPWVRADGTGIGFGSSTGFTLPNGAVRSPDLAWVKRSRWEGLTQQQRERFAPLCPDFVVEVRSRTDRLRDLQAKMQEYLDNGAELGWLIDPLEKKVYIYRPQAPVESLDNPQTVPGDPVLPGFVLEVGKL